jgi:hypothetical protein
MAHALDNAKKNGLYVYIKCLYIYMYNWGHAVAQLVEELRYKPEGIWFDFR